MMLTEMCSPFLANTFVRKRIKYVGIKQNYVDKKVLTNDHHHNILMMPGKKN